MPTVKGAARCAPSPSAPGAQPQGTHQFPFLPGGAHIASLAFDALGKEGDEGAGQGMSWDMGHGWEVGGQMGTDRVWGWMGQRWHDHRQ